jgi:hypothetical protein
MLPGLAALAEPRAKENAPPAIDDIEFAWRARHRVFKSVEIAIEGSKHQIAKLARVEETDGPQPDQDLSTRTSSRFILDDHWRARVEHQTKHWSTKEGNYVDVQMLEAFDGKRWMFVIPMSTLGTPFAAVDSRQSSPFCEDRFDLLPLKMVLCPVDMEANGGVLDNARPLRIKGHTEINSRRCVRIEQVDVLRGKTLTEVLFADIDQEYVPLRYEFRVDGRLIQMVQINELKKASDWLYLPIKWDAVFQFDKSSGQPVSSSREEVKSYRLNETIDPDLFRLEVPADAAVNDLDK